MKKIVVEYAIIAEDDNDERDDIVKRIESSKSYPPSAFVGKEERLQAVVDRYEDEGLTIDQGGDDNEEILDLPDGFTEQEEIDFGRSKAESLLRDIEAVLNCE